MENEPDVTSSQPDEIKSLIERIKHRNLSERDWLLIERVLNTFLSFITLIENKNTTIKRLRETRSSALDVTPESAPVIRPAEKMIVHLMLRHPSQINNPHPQQRPRPKLKEKGTAVARQKITRALLSLHVNTSN